MPRSRQYLLMDLFAGCGGMTHGFAESGFEPCFAVESNSDAAATYSMNFGHHVAVDNEGKPLRIEDIPRFPAVDVIIGGPPCQGFSPLNRDIVGFERRGLWTEYLRALEESRPRAFVMENVPQLLRSAEYSAFKKAATNLGYIVDQGILDAADFGVPQRRRRAIVIGTRFEPTPWPTATHADPTRLSLGSQPWKTFEEAVTGLPPQPDGHNWHIGNLLPHDLALSVVYIEIVPAKAQRAAERGRLPNG